MDIKVKANTEPEVLKQLILNTYTTILTRGIKGCYVYAYNENIAEVTRHQCALNGIPAEWNVDLLGKDGDPE